MRDFIVRNLTNDPVVLPSPISITLEGKRVVNLAQIPSVTPKEIQEVKGLLNNLEQRGKIAIDYVDDTEEAIGAAAVSAGDIHPRIVRDAMGEEIAIQIPAWNLNIGSVDTPINLKLCLTDDGGSPSLLTTHKPTMTVTASGVANPLISAGVEIAAGATDTADVVLESGMADITVQGGAGTLDIVISGSTPTNPVTGVVLAIVNDGGSPYQLTIS